MESFSPITPQPIQQNLETTKKAVVLKKNESLVNEVIKKVNKETSDQRTQKNLKRKISGKILLSKKQKIESAKVSDAQSFFSEKTQQKMDADQKSDLSETAFLNELEKHFPRMLEEIKNHPPKRFNRHLKIDSKFVCDQKTFEQFFPKLQQQLTLSKEFNTQAFLSGPKGQSKEGYENNEKILNRATSFFTQEAKQLAEEKNISLEDAYKLLIGIIDSFDDVAEAFYQTMKVYEAPSTFVLRSAILLASQKDAVNLQSWMVYTKSGKPDHKDMWTYLDNWKNWVPEAQAAMAKFTEVSLVKAKELAKAKPERIGIFLRGGFGAGKSRMAKELFQENVGGVSAPDIGKQTVRRSMEEVTHASAHVQGSQIMYKIFDDMIQNQVGTIAYDSSLSFARDVEDYLKKCQKANRKMVIYDIARNDMARSLAVLKRDVKGDDPRIPPNNIIASAVIDKLNRAECMQLVLNTSKEKGKEHLAPEYHFIAGDAKGWNTEEMMILSPQTISNIHPEMKERLTLEGLEIDETNKKVRFTKTKDELEAYYNLQFERPVKDIMQELSSKEQQLLYDTFSKRKLDIHGNSADINDASSFYNALSEDVRNVLPKKAFIQAFDAIRPETRVTFFESIKSQNTVSYLDLPLRAALIIHQNLQKDPWI